MALKGRALSSSLKALEKRGFIEQTQAGEPKIWTITATGYNAIGREAPAVRLATDSAKRPTKADAIAVLLRRPDGAAPTPARAIEAATKRRVRDSIVLFPLLVFMG